MFHKDGKLRTWVKVALLIVLAALIVLVQHLVLEHRAAEQYKQGYEDALTEAGILPTVADLDNGATVSAASLLEAVKSARELTTYKYFYEAVGDYKKEKKFFNTGMSVPFTEDRSIFSYRGVIHAGIDLNELSFIVDNENRAVTVTLPKPGFLSHDFEIDSLKVYDIKNSVFTNTDMSDYAGLESELKALQESRLQENEEFWASVRANTEIVLKDILTMSGQIEDYSLTFVWK